MLQFRAGRLIEAERTLTQYTEEQPSAPLATLFLAMTHKKLGSVETAESLKKAKSLIGDLPQTDSLLERVLLQQLVP